MLPSTPIPDEVGAAVEAWKPEVSEASRGRDKTFGACKVDASARYWYLRWMVMCRH